MRVVLLALALFAVFAQGLEHRRTRGPEQVAGAPKKQVNLQQKAQQAIAVWRQLPEPARATIRNSVTQFQGSPQCASKVASRINTFVQNRVKAAKVQQFLLSNTPKVAPFACQPGSLEKLAAAVKANPGLMDRGNKLMEGLKANPKAQQLMGGLGYLGKGKGKGFGGLGGLFGGGGGN